MKDGLLHVLGDDCLFLATRIPVAGVCTEATRRVYQSIFDLLQHQGMTQLLRIWNYVPNITGTNAEGLEVYQDFCRGRALAYEHNPNWRMPAATGIGITGDHIRVYLLAGRGQSVTHIENPNQVPAYRYPERYGPKSPSFARATHVEWSEGRGSSLFISGTASILQSESLHEGDVQAQTALALANVEKLISEENLKQHGLARGFGLADIDVAKVYVRHASDLPLIRQMCERHWSGQTVVNYFQAAICREELLMEVEALINPSGAKQ